MDGRRLAIGQSRPLDAAAPEEVAPPITEWDGSTDLLGVVASVPQVAFDFNTFLDIAFTST
jgi:hypothetical protein